MIEACGIQSPGCLYEAIENYRPTAWTKNRGTHAAGYNLSFVRGTTEGELRPINGGGSMAYEYADTRVFC